MNYVGDFAADETVYLNFASYDSNGASVTLTGLATSDIEIYKNGGTTQRSSDAGYTVSTDFDTITGIHAISIDTSDNTDAGFFAAGNDYVVIVSSVTIDSQTVSFVAGSFSIENRFMRGTDNAALASALATVDTNVDAILVDTGTSLPADIAALNDLSAAQVNAEVDTAIADAALATAASLATVDANVDAILVDTGTTIPAQITGLNDLSAADVNAEVDTALADIHLDHLLAVDYDPATPPGTATALLNELIESDAGVSRFTVNALENGPTGSGASAESIADAVWDEALSGHATAGSAGKAVADIEADATAVLEDTGTTIPALIAALNDLSAAQVNAEVDTAIADAALATAANLATVDGIVDAILVDTATTIPGLIAALNDLSAAQVNAEMDTALADYDGPTKAEIDAGLAALNDLSAAEVNAEVDTALADYDAPTKAELDAGLAALNDPTAAAIADAVLDEATAGHTTPGTVGAAIVDILADTNELQADDVPGLIAALNDISVGDILTTQITESYAANGVVPTLAQAMMMLHQRVLEPTKSGVTLTVPDISGSAAATFTVDDADNPQTVTRTT